MVRKPRQFYVCLLFALNHKKAFDVKRGVSSNMFDFSFVVIPKIIKAQAILFFVNDTFQLVLYFTAFRMVEHTFKNRVLDPLPVIDTLLCDLAQTLFTACCFRVHIIGYQNQHTHPPLPIILPRLTSKEKPDIRLNRLV